MVVSGFLGRRRREYRRPEPHPSGARPPKLPGELVPNHVAIVMDGEKFLGLITRIDLLNYLRRRAG